MAAAFDFETFWGMVEAARKKKGWSEETAAKACGFSRATWYNYRGQKFSPTIEDLQGIAKAFKFRFRAPLVKPGTSDPDRRSDGAQPTGGLHLSDAAQQVLVILATVPEEHHAFILETVKNAASIKGFQSPGEESAGHGLARPNR